MKIKVAAWLISAGISCMQAHAQQSTLPENVTIRKVLSDIGQFRESERKRDSALHHPLGSFGETDFRRRYDFHAEADRTLQSIDTASLSFQDKINLQLLRYSLEDELSDYRFRNHLNPILSEGGFHTDLTYLAARTPATVREYRDLIDRLNDIPRYVDEHLGLMRRGLSAGICQPRDIFKGFESTYEQHIVSEPSKSLFWKPFTNKPRGIDDETWRQLCADAEKAIRENVITSYRRIGDFFRNEYLPKTRTTAGALHLPDGENYYRERVRHYTTTDMTPDEIYLLGLQEVERIRKEMENVIREVGFKGTLQAFIAQLRNDPRFLPTTAEQLLKEASWIAKKADGKLPLLFGKLPRQPYSVEPVPADLAPVYTGGRYSPAPIRGKRSGQYWVNTYNLKSRTLYTLEALTLHEAVPGHHLQMSLTQELENIPEFRRNLYVNAFGEGWGLYCEYLGYEMGFYRDPYSRFGQLTYDMWRACRLVIDVGLHARGWTRDQSVKYLAEHTALSLHEVNTEINRYMAWPGQALAYKTGELRIKALRKKAQEELGEKFDVRSFHDTILSEGTVTMEILERLVEHYVADRKTRN
jgi:uncharacterized protein (DUF885 family)